MNEQFRAAVAAVYGNDTSQRHAANLWLDAFAKTPEAWGSALALLEPTSGASVEQQFFAANLLASKTRSDWGGLSPQQRMQLAVTFGALLRGMLLPPGASNPAAAAAAVASLEPVLLERVARLAATAAALGGPPTAERHLALARELADAAAAAAAAAAQQPSALDRLAAAAAGVGGGEALLRCSLLVLQLMAEEADALDSVRRKALLSGSNGQDGCGGCGGSGGLAGQRGGVVALAREAMAKAMGSGGGGGGGSSGSVSFSLLLAAVRCLTAWVRLDESGCADGGMAPGELQAMCPGLLPSVIGLLALPPPGPPTSSPLAAAPAARRQQQPAAALYAAVADLAADLLGPASRTCTAAAGGEAADVAAAAAAVEVLIGTGQQLAEAAAAEAEAEAAAVGGGVGDGGAALVALTAWVRVAVAVTERNAGGLATGPRESSVQLANCVMAALASCPSRRELAEACADYFLAINTVPTAERHPALAAPLYGALLPLVQRAVSYPAGFVDWESDVEDEEAFYRFRDQMAADLLESIWGQCRTQMVAQLVAEVITTAAAAANGGGGGGAPTAVATAAGVDWRVVEAALYCIRAVHIPVQAAALGGRAGELETPQAAATAADLQALLGRLFGDVCSAEGTVAGLLYVPWVRLSVSRLIAEYAAWLGKGKDAPLQAAMGLLLRALSVPAAAAAAAQGFRNCCVRGAERLTSVPAALSALASAAMEAVAPAATAAAAVAALPLGLTERCAVVEGLARLASGLSAEAAAEAGCALMAPCVARAQAVAAAAAAAGGPLSATTLEALAEELGLMTAVVRFLQQPGCGSRGGPPRLQGALAAAAATSGATGVAESSGDHPALRALQVAWPVLSAVASEPQCQRDPGVVEALAELYKHSLLCTKLAGRPLLPALIGAMLGCLRVRPHAAVLGCLATVVELFGEVAHSGEMRSAQIAALEGSVQMMSDLMAHLPVLQQQQQQQQQQQHRQQAFPATAAATASGTAASLGELAAAFFSLADRYLIFARELLLAGEGSAALPALVEWTCGVLVSMREREPAAAALSFLSHLLSAAARLTAEETAGSTGGGEAPAAAAAAAETRARLDTLFGRCGPRLVHALLTAGVDTCPLQLMRPLAGCLAGLTALADAGAAAAATAALPAAAASGAMPLPPPPVGPADSEFRRGLLTWLRGAWQLPPLAEVMHSGRLGSGGAHAAVFTDLLLRGHYPPAAAAADPFLATAAAANQTQQQLPPLARGRLDALVTDFFRLARGEADVDVMLAYELS